VPSERIRGADTDRGQVYIRYGPPNKRLGFQEAGAMMHEFWIYNASLMFAFDKFLHTGRARFPGPDLARVAEAFDWQPARWDNIAIARIDSMPTQVVRFRSGPDSVEVSLATRAPVEAFAEAGVEMSAQANLWLYGLDSPTAFTDSVTVGASGRLQWTRKLRTGAYYYRVESMIPSTLVAGRTAGGIAMGADTTTGFAMRGFGMSDLLLASRTNVVTSARRWIDFDPELLLGDVKRGGEISLVWETYEAGNRSGDAQYDVSVTIDRESSRLGRIAAEIVGRVASAIGVTRSDDRLAMTFSRRVPYAEVIPDAITLSLRDTPAGSYLLTVTIRDRVSGRSTQRTVQLQIAE
jgi:hypothetical protein